MSDRLEVRHHVYATETSVNGKRNFYGTDIEVRVGRQCFTLFTEEGKSESKTFQEISPWPWKRREVTINIESSGIVRVDGL